MGSALDALNAAKPIFSKDFLSMLGFAHAQANLQACRVF
jgi:hypothetical protein